MALSAAVSLALGFAAATVIFHVVDGVLARPLPYPHSDRLVMLWETNPGLGFERMWVSYPNFRDFAAGGAGVAEMAAYRIADLNLSSDAVPERLRAARITARDLAFASVMAAAARSAARALPPPLRPSGSSAAVYSDWLD